MTEPFGHNRLCFRLGFGKPLGFGSVRLSIPWEDLGNKMPIAKGKDMADRYKTLGEPEAFELTKDEARRLIQVYQKAMVQAYGGNQDADQSTEPDLYPWESLEFAQGLLDEEKEAFRNAWREALKSGHDVPLEALDGREIYLEEFPDLDDVLSKMYKDTLKAYQDFAKQDFGWGKLSFIKEFKASMKGFAEPVAYPRKSASNMEEGFAWFVENDRRENNRYVNGYSLPEIGKTLTGF